MELALNLEDYHPSVLLHCRLGHLTCEIVSEMTYNVSSGMLNPTIPYRISDKSKLFSAVLLQVEAGVATPQTATEVCSHAITLKTVIVLTEQLANLLPTITKMLSFIK